MDACLVTVGTLTEVAFHRVCFYYAMLDACVAEKALYLMISNMILMEELLGVFCFEDLPSYYGIGGMRFPARARPR